MLFPKKKWQELEKRVADLEKLIRSQPIEEIVNKLNEGIKKSMDSVSHIPPK